MTPRAILKTEHTSVISQTIQMEEPHRNALRSKSGTKGWRPENREKLDLFDVSTLTTP